MSNYSRFINETYSGRELLKKHRLGEWGIWRVLGEDPNCDFGGSHHNPYLGTYEGDLANVITIAVELKGFWQWGAGGQIEKTNVEKIHPETIAERNEKRKRLEVLEAEVKKLRKELCI